MNVEDNQPERANNDRDNMQIQDLLRMIISQRHDDPRFNTCNDLVRHLKADRVVQSNKIERAMLDCPRDMFVPRPHRASAFFDSPIRVESLDFNISAPHIHASFLEQLQVQTGQTVLDVGCGCGVVTAYLAMLAGPSGCVVGIDIKERIMQLCQSNLDTWKATHPEAASQAASIDLQLQNVFLPSEHVGQYDRVHVGAGCPGNKVKELLALLKPEGGVIVGPVDSEMRVIQKTGNGEVRSTSVSAVRFSELQVPTDAEVVLALIRQESMKHHNLTLPPSTFPQDLATIERSCSNANHTCITASSLPTQGSSPPSAEWACSLEGGCRGVSVESSEPWGEACGTTLGVSTSHSSSESEMMLFGGGEHGQPSTPPNPSYLQGSTWGPPDCVIQGEAFYLPAHRAVLQTRCEHFRARFASGMRDADAGLLHTPGHFKECAMISFLRYVYQDSADLSADEAVQVLHVAAYYGVPRLQVLCEKTLCEEVGRHENEEAARGEGGDLAAQLLSLADTYALPNLRAACISYMVQHYAQVSQTAAYKALDRAHVDDIAAEMARVFNMCTQRLQELSASSP